LDFHHKENVYSEASDKSIPYILNVPYLVQESAEVTQKTQCVRYIQQCEGGNSYEYPGKNV